MRYVDYLTVGDGTLKAHSPRLHYTSGNDRWREERSGLRPMRPEREAEVWREIEQTMRRKLA